MSNEHLERLEEYVRSNQEQHNAESNEQLKRLEEYVRSNQEQLNAVLLLLERRAADGELGEPPKYPSHIHEADVDPESPQFAPLRVEAWPRFVVQRDRERPAQDGASQFLAYPNEPLKDIVDFYDGTAQIDVVCPPASHYLSGFLDQVHGRLGEAARRTETARDLLFMHDAKILRVDGYRVLSHAIVAEICNLLDHPVVVAAWRAVRPQGASGRDLCGSKREVLKYLLEDPTRQPTYPGLSALWANTISYALLLDQDLKGTNYVDKRRYETNLNTYNALNKELVRKSAEAIRRYKVSL